MRATANAICLIALAPLFQATAQESPALVAREIQTRFSNDGKIRVQFDPGEHPEVHVWISSADKPETRIPLGDKFFYVQNVSISPEGNWIVVKDGTASAGTSLELFRRTEGLEYKEAGQVDPETALKVLIEKKKIPGDFESAHLHATVVGWLNEERGDFVVSISGDGGAAGRQTHSLSWVCLYNPSTGKIRPLNETILRQIKRD